MSFFTNFLIELETNIELRKTIYLGSEMQLDVMHLAEGQAIGEHSHPESDKLFIVLRGVAKATVEKSSHELAAGDMLVVGRGIPHNIVNTGMEPCKIFAVYSPPPPPKDS